jgi:UDP-N-acetylglucosamine acyltransferase
MISRRFSMPIHPTAVIDRSSEIAPDADIGPYCIIGPEVRIGSKTILESYVHVHRWTAIGEGNRFSSHVSVGGDPQDLKYKGEKTFLTIGDHNDVREFATLNRGTSGGGGVSSVGNGNLLMAYAHVAHDCCVGNGIVMDNAGTLGGHVMVADHATIGAFTAVHQFCRIGPHAFIGGFSVVTRDALPYIKTVGARNQAKIYGINTIGLERKDIPRSSIEELKQAYRILFRSGLNTGEALARMREREWDSREVATLVNFIETSERGFIR